MSKDPILISSPENLSRKNLPGLLLGFIVRLVPFQHPDHVLEHFLAKLSQGRDVAPRPAPLLHLLFFFSAVPRPAVHDIAGRLVPFVAACPAPSNLILVLESLRTSNDLIRGLYQRRRSFLILKLAPSIPVADPALQENDRLALVAVPAPAGALKTVYLLENDS
ncbi:hypothetical protein PG990_006985 [Apiospora arundinis]